MADVPTDRSGERLESWKEIAAYLKRDVRTARRWEKLEGLPVHRHVHHKLATVYAFTAELDSWRAQRAASAAAVEPEPPVSRWRSGAIILGGLAAAAAAVVALIAIRGARAPAAPPSMPAALAPRIPGRLLAGVSGEDQQPTPIVPARDVTALRMTPDGARLLFVERDERRVQILDTATNQIRHTVAVPGLPNQIVLSPDGRSAYVGTEEGDVARLDLEGPVLQTLARGLTPVRDLALSADGASLYITAVFNGLHILDTRSGQVRAVPTVRCPMHLAIVPGKDLAYVSYQCGGPGGRSGHDAIDVRIASSGAAKTSITGPPQVGGEIQASPDGAQIWINGVDACLSEDYDRVGCPAVPGGVVNVYRVDDNYLLGSLGLPGANASVRPVGISFFPDGSRAILSGTSLKVVDIRSLKVVEDAPVSSNRIVFSNDGSRAYAAPVGAGPGHLALFDTGSERCVPPPERLAAWWPGDGHANDIHEDHPGELRDGAAIAPGWVGQAFRFDGRGAHVHVANVNGISAADDLTAAVWIKPTASKARVETILDHGSAGTNGWKLVRHADDTIAICEYGTDGECDPVRTVHSPTTAPPGRWTHVAAVSAHGRVSLFTNGEAAATRQLPPRHSQQRFDFHIGGSLTDRGFFEGLADEVQLFRRALTAGDVRRIFDAGRYGLCYR